MTDELAPEEREALKNLPRERMPSAGLEDRVVGAMRARGLLAAKPAGRVVRISTGRMAGVLAASLALMIGAYSIGLHRGGDNEVIRSVQPLTPPVLDETIRHTTPVVPESERAASLEKEDAPATLAVPATPAEKKEKAEETARLDWSLKDTDAGRKDDAAKSVEASPASESVQVQEGRSNEPRQRAEPPAPSPAARSRVYTLNRYSADAAAPSAPRERSFRLGDTALLVEAPDSVRIIEDARGRMLLIYTSDGLIRLRLVD